MYLCAVGDAQCNINSTHKHKRSMYVWKARLLCNSPTLVFISHYAILKTRVKYFRNKQSNKTCSKSIQSLSYNKHFHTLLHLALARKNHLFSSLYVADIYYYTTTEFEYAKRDSRLATCGGLCYNGLKRSCFIVNSCIYLPRCCIVFFVVCQLLGPIRSKRINLLRITLRTQLLCQFTRFIPS